MYSWLKMKRMRMVAPRVGAWIEIVDRLTDGNNGYVAPRVGAWIEIGGLGACPQIGIGRSPCGSVD